MGQFHALGICAQESFCNYGSLKKIKNPKTCPQYRSNPIILTLTADVAEHWYRQQFQTLKFAGSSPAICTKSTVIVLTVGSIMKI